MAYSSTTSSVENYPYPWEVNVLDFVPDKLSDAKCYPEWKRVMVDFIESQGLLGFVDGSTKRVSQAASSNSVSWRRSNNLVRGWILTTLDKDTRLQVLRYKSARGVWTRLVDMFDRAKKRFQLDEETAKKLSSYLPLRIAAIEGDWDTASKIIESDPDIVRAAITPYLETTLFLAVKSPRRNHFVEQILKKMSPEDAGLANIAGMTALHRAASIGNVEAAKLLVNKNPNLPNVLDEYGDPPLNYAARTGSRESVVYLWEVTKEEAKLKDDVAAKLLHDLTREEHYDIALTLLQRKPELACMEPSVLNVLVEKCSSFRSGTSLNFWQSLIYSGVPVKSEHIANRHSGGGGNIEKPTNCCIFSWVRQRFHSMFWEVAENFVPQIKNIREKKLIHHHVLQLLKLLCVEIAKLNFSKVESIFGLALLSATYAGIHEIVEEILVLYPLGMVSQNEVDGTLFHYAIMWRRERVFNLIYQLEAGRRYLTELDKSNNNGLHLAGCLRPQQKLNLRDSVAGPVLQMQRELQWFKSIPTDVSRFWCDCSSSSIMTTVGVTLPASLAFLVSNFHSLVNIKLDGTNYLLWRIQVENVMHANGFYGYLDGSIVVPPSKLRDAEGTETLNPAYTLWCLIDSQLLSCLTASLSTATLPYVLGLRHATEVWFSLSNRYNALSETHVQELRTQLYNHSKTSTVAIYIDKIKELAQKLAAAGSPIDDNELVFHTLRGLPKAFNGLKTAVRAVRTQGHTLSFDEVVMMLNSEDVQLLQESPDVENSTVLMTTHTSHTTQPSGVSLNDTLISSSSGTNPSTSLPQPYSQTMSSISQLQPQNQFQQMMSQNMPSFHQFLPQMPSFPNASRGFTRGRGGRGPRFPRDPCEICGRTNHITAFCYYGPTGGSWRSQSFQQPPWMYSGQFSGGPPMQSMQFSVPRQFGGYPRQFGGYPSTFGHPPVSSTHAPQAHFTSYAGNYDMTRYNGTLGNNGVSGSFGNGSLGNIGMTSGYGNQGSSENFGLTAGYGHQVFSGNVGMPSAYGTQGQSGPSPLYGGFSHSAPSTVASSSSQPWFFDSGATNHITNNLQNLTHPQIANGSDGIMVGNGSTLQVTHTGAGQAFSENSVPRTLPQGVISHPDLL